MSISGLIRKKSKPSRILLFILLAPVAAVSFLGVIFMAYAVAVVAYMAGSMLSAAITKPPLLADIATVDMRLGGSGVFAEHVYISHDGSYIGITPDRSGEDKDNVYEFTLVPRSEFEQHTDRIVSISREGEDKYFKQEFDPRDDTYTIYGETSSEEEAAILGREYAWGDSCKAAPMRVTRNHLQTKAGCSSRDERTLMLEVENRSAPDTDLPLYFKESSRYTSPLSDCAAFPTNAGDKKTICYRHVLDRRRCGFDNYCNVHRIRFTNTKTQQQVTKKIPDYITEGGFLDDGTFYLAFNGGPGHAQGVYIVPGDCFINNL